MKRPLYDPECEKLAKYFLQDAEVTDEAHMRQLVEELAQAIQEVVEQWWRLGKWSSNGSSLT